MLNTTKTGIRLSPLLLITALILAGCNSTDSSLGVDNTALPPIAAPDTANGNLPAPTAPTQQQAASTQVASLAPNAALSNVYFSPIVGAPVSKVTALSRRLSTAAATNSVALQPSSSRSINHEIRGYFSALSEGGTTTVIHVWDVFSPQGQRVHRIQGQEKVAGTGADPWAVIPNSAMERIADSVLSQYATWRSGS